MIKQVRVAKILGVVANEGMQHLPIMLQMLTTEAQSAQRLHREFFSYLSL
jgi:hypothetical protein